MYNNTQTVRFCYENSTLKIFYIGKIDGVGVKSKKYDLEATEYVTEIYAHFPQVNIYFYLNCTLLKREGKMDCLIH